MPPISRYPDIKVDVYEMLFAGESAATIMEKHKISYATLGNYRTRLSDEKKEYIPLPPDEGVADCVVVSDHKQISINRTIADGLGLPINSKDKLRISFDTKDDGYVISLTYVSKKGASVQA
jgi:hypothetical protein